MKSFYQISKEIVLLLAGTYFGILVIPFEKDISRNLVPITVVLVAMLLYGIGLLEWIASLWFSFWKWWNAKQKKVGIFAPFEILLGKNCSWVDIDLLTIKNLFDSKKIKHGVETNKRAFKEHRIILNPFGGVYPEKDLSNLQSLNLIFDFVRDGGIYINIADIPFYYAFDKNLNRRVDTTPLAGDFTTSRSFFQTILTRKLHCFVLGLPNGMPGKPEVKRVIQLSSPNSNLFEGSVEENETGSFSPVLKIAYGKGFFIFSTLQINQKNIEENLMRVINTAIKL